MSLYAIGDVQGCFDSLKSLLNKIQFNPNKDKLWFAGDLINRGPKSLETLRFIAELGGAAQTVLGNHDLHALAVYYGYAANKSKDTLTDILEAEDCAELMSWLRQHPLALYDQNRDVLLTHAGIPPQWSVDQTLEYAGEVSRVLVSDNPEAFFAEMYGNHPEYWHHELSGAERLRVITNYLTRMRFIDASGGLEFKSKQALESAPEGFDAWFNYPRNDSTRVVFGHWAALQGVTNVENCIALDTGCVWGGKLRAVDLDTWQSYDVDACD